MLVPLVLPARHDGVMALVLLKQAVALVPVQLLALMMPVLLRQGTGLRPAIRQSGYLPVTSQVTRRAMVSMPRARAQRHCSGECGGSDCVNEQAIAERKLMAAQ